jgi:hypothetical protein
MAWIGLLAVASFIFNFFFACGSPFAALATIAAITLPAYDALVLMLFAWLANQLVGFGLLGYPQETTAFIWGGVMGVAAITSALAARFAVKKSLPIALIFLAALAVHQLSMLLAALTPLGGLDGFTFDVIGRVASVNLLGLVVFYILNRVTVAVHGTTSKARI